MNKALKNTILDGAILLFVSSILAVSIIQIPKFFVDNTNNAATISSLVIKKSESENSTISESFRSDREKAMEEINNLLKSSITKNAREKDSSSIKRDLHNRSILMMLCNANYDNYETILEIDGKRLPFIYYFIKNGEKIHAMDNDGWTPLFWASWSGLPTITELLIQLGSNVNISDKVGNTPLMMASLKGHQETVAILLRNGADKKAVCETGMTALDYAQREYQRMSKPAFTEYIPWLPHEKAANKKRLAQTIELLKAN